MKIILANRYFYPDQSATSRMVSGLAFALARRGHEVAVIASRHFHDRRERTLPARETIDGVAVHRLSSSGFGRPGTAGRAADYATFHLSAAAWLGRHARRGDLCVLCTDPPLLSLSAALPLAMRGVRVANWVMDLFPETAMEVGMVGATGAGGRALLALRDRAHAAGDLVICPTGSMARYLETRGAVGRLGSAVVEHWSNGDEIRPVERGDNTLRREWGIGDEFVVGYSGNFGRAHEFDTLLDAAGRLAEAKDIRFLMIGDGKQHDHVVREVARRGLDNVIFKPLQPSERLAESIGAADVHIVSLLPKLEHCIVPSKLYGILAAARPAIFVGDPQGEVAKVLARGACGASVQPGEGAKLAEAILTMRNDPARTQAMGGRARALFEKEYAYEEGVSRWLRAVAPLLSAPSPAISGAAARLPT